MTNGYRVRAPMKSGAGFPTPRHKTIGAARPPPKWPPTIGPQGVLTELIPPNELEIGAAYVSWICHVCGKIMAYMRTIPGNEPEVVTNNAIRIKCPHCGAVRHHPIAERRVRIYGGP